MEAAKRSRTGARSWLTRAAVKLEQVLADKDSDKPTIEDAVAELNKRLDSVEEAQRAVELLIDDSKVLEADIAEAFDIQDKVCKIRILATKRITKLEDDGSSSSGSQHVKLPKLYLPKFGGMATDWPSWWDQFRATIDESELPAVTKMTYLQGLLEGEAKSTIEGLTLTQKHYEVAKQLLEERYGRRELIVFSHIQALINLKSKDDCKDNLSKLKSIQDQVNIRVRSLEALGVDSRSSGVFLTPLILSRLPSDVRMEWAREGQGKEDNLGFLLDFLKTEIERRQRADTFKIVDQKNDKSDSKKSDKQKSSKNPKGGTASALQTSSDYTSKEGCVFCKRENHTSKSCWSAKRMKPEDRKQAAIDGKLCFKCLCPGHLSKQCSSVCSICKKGHHKIFCQNTNQEEDSKKRGSNKGDVSDHTADSSVANVSCVALGQSSVLLQTTKVVVQGPSGKTEVNVLFDSGSDKTYITDNLVRKLKLKSVGSVDHRYAVFGGGKSSTEKRQLVKFNLLGKKRSHEVIGIQVPKICTALDKPRLPENILRKFNLSNTDDSEKIHIDILVGLDYYWSFMGNQIIRVKNENLVAQETVFGFVLSGQVRDDKKRLSPQLLVLNDLSEQEIRRFWDLEHIGIKGGETKEDDHVYKEFVRNITYDDKEKRYTVSLPWKSTVKDDLKCNEKQAVERTQKQHKKIAKDEHLVEMYQNVFQEWEQKKMIEEVPAEELHTTDHPVFYLPHRPVVREDRMSTKVRPVFDGGAKDCNGLSLNDCLSTGPKLHPDLVDILMRFRQHKISLTADVTKAFLQILIRKEDRDVTRFLLIDSKSSRVMRFTRVPFGLNCSPFLLNATVRHHLSFYSESQAAEELRENLYVDDLLTGADEEKCAAALYSESNEIMEEAGMSLCKWQCNHKEIVDKDLSCDQESTKVLGIQWYPSTDEFGFEGIEVPVTLVVTKRLILSCIARIFDPLGLIQPFIISAKIMFQEAWRLGTGWDEEIPDIADQFQRWLAELQKIKAWRVPRRYSEVKFSESEKSLHLFCDASEKAYGAVVYVETEDGLSLVVSRGKLAPLKRITLPRLELLACFIGARLLIQVKSALHLKGIKYHCWTDSQIALGWIKGDPCRWKPFVSNRVQTIQEITDPANWHHCPGQQNPADLLTRGLLAQELSLSALWLNGPDLEALEYDSESEVPEVQEEAKTTKDLTLLSLPASDQEVFDTTRWSKFSKGIRVAAWVLRFIARCRKKPVSKQTDSSNDSELSQEEVDEGKRMLIIKEQQKVYANEIQRLQKNIEVPKHSKLYHLNPFLDESGVLRVKGRLQNASLTYAEKHPIILPKGWLAKILVRDQHKALKHAGVSTLLTLIRNEYWIHDLRRIAKTIVKDCVPCQKLMCKAVNQSAAPLPVDRVTSQKPFSYTGVDFAGPLYVSDDDSKVYICLFTCGVIRAVHLELVHSLTVEDFLFAFRRFVGRRGLPKLMHSDNAKTFKGAQVPLRKLYGEQTPNWKYITPKSPWHGGFWERLVRTVKSALKKTIQNSKLSKLELEAVLIEVEYVVNSRPLTQVVDELTATSPITPNHFLVCRFSDEETDVSWVAMQHKARLKSFWKLWTEEYLKNLPRVVPKFKDKFTLQNGSMVLMENDNLPRLQWPLGRVIEMMPGKDEKIRTVRVKTTTGEYLRPVQKLYHLEMLSPHSEEDEISAADVTSPASTLQPHDVVKTTKTKKDEKKHPTTPKVKPQTPPIRRTQRGRVIKPVRKLDL